jgi:hypothetical protein
MIKISPYEITHGTNFRQIQPKTSWAHEWSNERKSTDNNKIMLQSITYLNYLNEIYEF